MINRRILIVTATLLHIVAVLSVTDHLVPPPPPPPDGPPAGPPLQIQPPANRQARPQAFVPSRQVSGPQNEPPGFMQRIARWFGFSDSGSRDQQLQGSQQYNQYKESPRGQYQNGRKAPCGLCNKYPWVPMFPGTIQYPLSKHYQIAQANQIHQVQWNPEQEQLYRQQQQQQQKLSQQQLAQQQLSQLHLTRQQQEQLAGYNYAQQQQQLPQYPPLNVAESQYAPTNFQPPLVQRAVQFNSQPPQDFRPPPPPPHKAGNPPPPYTPQSVNPRPQYTPQPNFAPIPIPNLSPSPLPPIYDAQPFRPTLQQQPQQPVDPTQYQQLPKFQPTVQFQEQTPNTFYTEQQPPSFDDPPQFQQIQDNAHPQINENIGAPSEIQNTYPTQTPPSSFPQQQTNHQAQTTPSFEIIKSHQVTNFVSEIEYPPNYGQSHSIDVPLVQTTTTVSPQEQAPVTLTEIGSYSPQYTQPPEEQQTNPQDSIVYHNHQEVDNYATDNYPSASSHNLSVQHENNLDIDPIQHSSSENYYPQSEVFVPTPEPTTAQPQFVTDLAHHSTTVEIVPSLQTTFTQRLNYKRDRETPKRLLDSPINYLIGGSSPRPFTRDPSDIRIRASSSSPPYPFPRNEIPPTPTPTPWHMAPTPTSTYTSLDASGQYAGMTPPAQQQTPKQFQQIIIPYTTKHKPRPFQPKEQAGRYENWATSGEFDPHEQQESKVVTATQAPAQRTTKYLTKILATNLRELLKKEHEVKDKSKTGFDLSKLQKNIDDWTEQEFTSLSHKASTVSLRGHSKHIPTEYLTTTPSMREAKASTTFPSNHLAPLLYKERGTKRYEFQHLDDNRIEAHGSTTTPIPSTTPTTTTSTTSTTEPSTVTPFYVRAIPTTEAPKENWNQVKVTVSPLTKEKLYVVTPQPKHAPAGTGNFKSPRFIVRPTPASAGSNTSPRPTLYTPELFGLMGISAYIPAAPVETIDGHSKVITIVTPSNSLKTSASTEASSASKSESSDSSNGDRASS